MRRSFHAPIGNTYVGPGRPSNLELPARGEEWGRAVYWIIHLAVLRFLVVVALRTFDFGVGGEVTPVVLFLLKLALVVGFGVHGCLRYTLMRPRPVRRNALLAFALVGLPAALLWEWSFLLLLLAPVAAWRAVVSWLTYPDNPTPGLFRSPLGPQWARLLLSLACDLPTAAAAFVPATFFTRTDDGHR